MNRPIPEMEQKFCTCLADYISNTISMIGKNDIHLELQPTEMDKMSPSDPVIRIIKYCAVRRICLGFCKQADGETDSYISGPPALQREA